MPFYHFTIKRKITFKDLVFGSHPILGNDQVFPNRRIIQARVRLTDKEEVSVVQGLSFDNPDTYEVALIVDGKVISECVWGLLDKSGVDKVLYTLQNIKRDNAIRS